MKKQSLSRAAALIAASTLAVGLAATTAAADPGKVGGGSTGGPTGTVKPGKPGKGGSEYGAAAGPSRADRKIARLIKALDRARDERAHARESFLHVKRDLSDADLWANTSKADVLAATETEHAAAVRLAEARTNLVTVRALIKDTLDALTVNEQAQSDAAAAHTTAVNARNTAQALVDTITADRQPLADARDTAAVAVTDVETDIAWLESLQSTYAADLSAANAENDRLGPLMMAASDTYQERTLAYQQCVIPDDVHVQCMDNSGVWAERGEVTEAWGIYMDLYWQRMAAQGDATTAQQSLTDTQNALAPLPGLLDLRRSEHTLAQEALDLVDADLADAQGALTDAQAEVVKQADLLDTLPAQADALTAQLSDAQQDEKATTVVEAQRVEALTTATATVKDTERTHEAALSLRADVQQVLNETERDLIKAQDRARTVKDRLIKAYKDRKANR